MQEFGEKALRTGTSGKTLALLEDNIKTNLQK
jgi:hypothetical protein